MCGRRSRQGGEGRAGGKRCVGCCVGPDGLQKALGCGVAVCCEGHSGM